MLSQLFIVLTLVVPGRAADTSADAILNQYIEASRANHLRAQHYTYTNKETHIFFDSQGREKSSNSKTFEMMFVEGSSYRRLVAIDDQPLSSSEAAKEEKRLQQTAEERRHQRAPLTSRHVDSASNDDLLQLFTCTLTGEEELQNRKAWLIQCDPQPGRIPQNQHEKEVLATSRKLWIDQHEHIALKTVDTALEGHPVELPGSTITNVFALINNDVWMPVSTTMDGHLHIAKFIKPKIRTVYENSNFKKFDVQSTITPTPQ